MRTLIFTLLFLFDVCRINAQFELPVITISDFEVDHDQKAVLINYNVESLIQNEVLKVEGLVFNLDDARIPYDRYVVSGDTGTVIANGLNRTLTVSFSSAQADLFGLKIKLIAQRDLVPTSLQLVSMVDADTIRERLDTIVGPRHFGSSLVKLNAVREFIKNYFTELGLQLEVQNFPYNNVMGQNIVGSKKGLRNPLDVIIIDAHYDSVNNSPGADDNGSGTVGILEAARILAPFNFDKSIAIIGFDHEEQGLIGSKYLVTEIPEDVNVIGVLNLEMIGYHDTSAQSQTLPQGFSTLFPTEAQNIASNQYRGDFIASIGTTQSSLLAQAFVSSAAEVADALKVESLIFDANLIAFVPDLARSDHAPFWQAGIPALLITDSADLRNPHYHKTTDVVSTLDLDFMQNVIKTAIATTAKIAEPCLCSADEIILESTSTNDSQASDCQLDIEMIEGDKLELGFSNCSSAISKIMLSNTAGQVIMSKQFQNFTDKSVLQLEALTPGIYIVSALTEKGNIYSKKVFISSRY